MQNRDSIKNNPKALAYLKAEVAKAEAMLENDSEATIQVPSVHFSMHVTKDEVSQTLQGLVDRAIGLVERAVEEADLRRGECHVIVTGTAEKVAILQPFIERQLTSCQVLRADETTSDTAIVHGAAIQASILSGDDGVEPAGWITIVPLSLGIATVGGVFTPLINRNMVVPVRES
jgi:molecular chaperone DnaK (HSP70)